MSLLSCKGGIAIDVVAKWENWGISGDFLKYGYLIPLNAKDLCINVFQPECVVFDTDPLKLLRIICSLPMGS